MKHLKLFQTEAEYTTFIQSEDFVLPNVSYLIDNNTTYYHVVKTETGDYKIYIFEKKDISGLTYNMVDLGLPSGLKWADRNVGASSPEDFGAYFSWGETVGYMRSTKYCTEQEACKYFQTVFGDAIEVTPDTLKELSLSLGVIDGDFTKAEVGFIPGNVFADWSNYFDTTDGGISFNKYGGELTTLQPEDDTVTVNMGASWRMPTKSDFNELINNCTATFIDRDGNEIINVDDAFYNLKGVKFTGSNGNSIFIPACGYLAEMFHSSLGRAPQPYYEGTYWTSECKSSEHGNAINMVILSECKFNISSYHGASYVDINYRYCGQSVRGVCN